MILAAGLGTRLKPFTNKHPKALAEVNGKTLLQRNIGYLLSYGIADIIVNIHHFPEQIKEYVITNNGFGANIFFSDETDKVLETGGGLMRAEWFLKDSDPFVLLNVDVLTDMNLQDMINHHKEKQALATLAVSDRVTSRYFVFDKDGRLGGWENVKTGEQRIRRNMKEHVDKAFSGISVVSTEIFQLNKRKGKFSIVDLYLDLTADHFITSFDHTGSKFIDVGKPERLKEAKEIFK